MAASKLSSHVVKAELADISNDMCEELDAFQTRFEVIGCLLDTVSEESRQYLLHTLFQLKLMTLTAAVENLLGQVSAETPSRLLNWTWYGMAAGMACTVPYMFSGFWKGTNTIYRVIEDERALQGGFWNDYKASRRYDSCRYEMERLFRMDTELVKDSHLIDFAATGDAHEKWMKKIEDSVFLRNLNKDYLERLHGTEEEETNITAGYKEFQILMQNCNVLSGHESAKLYYLQ